MRFWLLCGALATLAGCTAFDQKQRELVYRATPGRPADFAGLRPGDRIERIDVAGDNGTPEHVQLWWLPHPDPQAPTLLYLHGTFRNLFQNHRKIESLRDAGFAVVAVEYRGWGESSARVPSEASIYADAETGWRELVRRQPDPARRVIYGHSMGGGVAVELASRKRARTEYAGLMLESTFTRMPDVARAAGVVGSVAAWFATQRFDSTEKIGRVDAPILMMHGTADRTVPFALGQALHAAAPAGARWVPFPAGSHSYLDRDAPELYRRTVRQFISELP